MAESVKFKDGRYLDANDIYDFEQKKTQKELNSNILKDMVDASKHVQVINSNLPEKSLEENLEAIKAQLPVQAVCMGWIRPKTPNRFYIMFKAGLNCTVITYAYSVENQILIINGDN